MSARTRNLLRAGGWLAVLALALVGGRIARAPRGASSTLARLLGPIGSLAASVQWVRFDAALDAGRPDRAYARARLALELDPGGTEGWSYFAGYFARQRASAEAESDPTRRVGWVRAGLDVLVRGEASAREPEDLAVERGLVLTALGDSELAPHWPGGRAACFDAAVAAFERAGELGHALGAELAGLARAAGAREE